MRWPGHNFALRLSCGLVATTAARPVTQSRWIRKYSFHFITTGGSTSIDSIFCHYCGVAPWPLGAFAKVQWFRLHGLVCLNHIPFSVCISPSFIHCQTQLLQPTRHCWRAFTGVLSCASAAGLAAQPAATELQLDPTVFPEARLHSLFSHLSSSAANRTIMKNTQKRAEKDSSTALFYHWACQSSLNAAVDAF